MESKQKLPPIQLDALKEAGNIGAAHAATALSALLGKKVLLHVPGVSTVSLNDISELAGGPEQPVAAICLRVDGEVKGMMFFILSVGRANRFIRQLTGDDTVDFSSPPASELAISAFNELGNILAGSYLSALSDFTSLRLHPSVPAAAVDMAGAIVSSALAEASVTADEVIVIDTVISEENAELEEVKGHMFLLPDASSRQVLLEALGVGT
ncbi:chemotaxis protein CheC [Indiicoccus explosivorum]|uniref:chemotaxis protein CheC n=1 Tax=Indiicoccus explosivorum TaxID=1917864 RepID=UPI000B43FBD5|nr:chemotaxis protein CheC [Indiicoccus explosivorum]